MRWSAGYPGKADYISAFRTPDFHFQKLIPRAGFSPQTQAREAEHKTRNENPTQAAYRFS